MIYTSYFANLRKLPVNTIPISICGKAPDWYKGLQYKTLAPKYGFFMKWKENHDNDFYIKHFNEEILDLLNADNVVDDLQSLILKNGIDLTGKDIALICYEKPIDFCHRHLVSNWLRENGYCCEEYYNLELII